MAKPKPDPPRMSVAPGEAPSVDELVAAWLAQSPTARSASAAEIAFVTEKLRAIAEGVLRGRLP